jgi:hypothetical protein
MRAASILLALVVVLSAREAGAEEANVAVERNYAVVVAGRAWGFMDGEAQYWTANPRPYSAILLGPYGRREVPFSATQGLIGFCLIVPTLIALLATFTVRWKRKRAI